LIALARNSAPDITLQIANIGANLAQTLDQQQIDIALGAFDRVPARFRSEVLFRDEIAWVIATHHPLASRSFDHAAFLDQPRLVIGVTSPAGRSRELPARDDLVRRVILETDDEAVSRKSTRRPLAPMMVYDAATALAVTAASDLVTLMPRRYAKACAHSAQIRIIDFPRDRAETIELSMLWHSRAHDDPGLLWLRGLVHQAVNLASSAAGSRGGANRTRPSVKKIKKASARSRRT
jgi:DNA-binding transcriptional LysR family regulator